jgi:hypothetical protein
MNKFGLSLHPEKTQSIEFGRFAAENRKRRGERKPETFNFLGFTHFCGCKGLSGGYIVKRKTMAKRLRGKLQEVREWLKSNRHLSIPEQGRWLKSVVQGYFHYHAVPGNGEALVSFRTQINKC